MTVESNSRFKIRAYLRLAEISQETERGIYLQEAARLLDELPDSPLFEAAEIKRDACKKLICELLSSNCDSLPCKTIEKECTSAGFSLPTIRRAKDELRSKSVIVYRQRNLNGERCWWIDFKKEEET